jgi:alanine racemase
MLLVMGEVPYSGISDLVKNNITATVYNAQYAKLLSAEAVKQGKIVNIHIKIDTGLRRLGVRVGQQLAELMTEVGRLPNLYVEGAFTHLANGYDLDKTWTHRQTAEYNAALTQLEEMGYCLKLRHMANTASTVASPETYFDMVRVAALVFGYDISPGIENRLHLEPSITWTSRIMHILNVNPGESISYYNCYVAPKHMKVAIASFGMGDGYVRTLVSKNSDCNMYVLVNGKRARIIDIAFDQTFLDVTGIDEVKLDDEITVIGRDGEEEITTMQLAERANTSNGHICCSFSSRPYRHYIYNDKPYSLPGK